MEFVPHSQKQREALLSDKKITICLTGIQWGKTTIGAVWMKLKMHQHTWRRDNFIIAAPTYKILNQATIPAFMEYMQGLGTLNKSDMTFNMTGGGKAYFRTGAEPDSVVGITNVRAVWGDEMGKYTKYFYDNLQARASFKDAPIMGTTTPYSLNFLHHDLVKPTMEGKRDDVMLIQASSKESPYFPDHEFERMKAIMEPARFAATYGGEFARATGLVFSSFSDVDNIVDNVDLPAGTVYYAGVDWGFTDPFVIVVRAITPEGDHYQVAEFYKAGLTPSQCMKAAQAIQKTWDIKTFYCDPSQPGVIKEWNKNGLSAVGAQNDIWVGIDVHYELIARRKYKVLRGTSPHTLDEYEMYHYPEPKDLGPDQDQKDSKPVDQYNHTMDANRYVSMGTRNRRASKDRDYAFRKEPRTMQKKLDALKKANIRAQQTEEW